MEEKERKEFRSSLGLLVRSSAFVFAAVVISKIFTYLYRIVIARFYGPEVYGLFTLSLMITGWAVVIASIGLNQGLLRFISIYRGKKEKNKTNYIFKRVLLLTGIVSVLAGVVLFALSGVLAESVFHSPDLAGFLKIFSIVIPLTVVSGVFLAVLRAYEKIGSYSFISRSLGNFSRFVIIGILIFLGVSVISVPISEVLAWVLTLVFSIFYGLKALSSDKTENKKLGEKEGGEAMNSLLSYSWPLLFFGVVGSLLHWTDTLIIGIFRSVEEVGFYNVAIPLAFLLTVSVDLFRQLFFPLVTKEYAKGNKGAVKNLGKQVGKWIYTITLPIFILFIFFPEVFIQVMFGSEYLAASNSLRILAIGALFVSVFELSKEIISMKGKSKTILADIVFFGILNLILNLILVPKFGITGAAVSTTISLVLLNLTFAYQSHKYLGIVPIRKEMINVTFVGILSAVVLVVGYVFFPGNLLVLIEFMVLYLLLYLVLIFNTNSLDSNDLEILRSIKRKILG